MTDRPGIRCAEPDYGDTLVHALQDDDYGLDDIPELFHLGQLVPDPDGRVRVALSAEQIRELKVMADAYSFDFEAGLIDLCSDLHRFASERRAREFVFVEDA